MSQKKLNKFSVDDEINQFCEDLISSVRQMKVVPIAFDDCMAIRGFLINDVNSKVIKSLDISEYSRSIYDLITNEKLRCKLSENAFNCLHYFTVKNVMLRWVDLYNSLLK